MLGIDTVLYIAILYDIFLAVPLLYLVVYIVSKSSEPEKEEVFKEEMKRKTRGLGREKMHSFRSVAMPVAAV